MSVRKDEKRGTWLVKLHYTNHDGETIDSTKRGFKTKTEALAWERDFLTNEARSTSMTFEQFVKVYAEDVRPRLRETTWRSKEYMISEKLIPFFGKMRVVDITSRDIMDWQNTLLKAKDKNGKKYSETYIRTVENQLSAILNHAVKHYGLPSNPLQKAGRVGEKQGNEMKFWTTEEYLKFSEQVVDRPEMFYAYEILYWCGLREGELLALTAKDIDTKNRTISVTKSYSRLNGRDIIGKPKTKKSERVIALPRFLAQELQEYMEMEREPNENERLFPFTKYALNNTLKTAAKLAGVKEIRVHDLRHSHVSLLINLGFTAVAIADRMGHESVHITYRYAHLFPNQQRNMADVLDALMNARGEGHER